MNPFDMIAGGTLLVSGAVGWVRGATRELTTVIAFLVAALAAVFGLRFTAPIAGHFIHVVWMAETAAVLILFIAVYILLRTMGAALTQSVRHTPLSSFDRLLGFGIGLVRGLVVLGGFVLLFEAATPPERMPAWMTGARLYPLGRAAAGGLQAVAPQGMRAAHMLEPVIGAAIDQAAPEFAPKPARGYSGPRRHALDILVEKTR